MKAKQILLAQLGALAILFCLLPPCHAQYSATVQGTVTDPGGAVLPGAAVTLTNIGTGIADTTATDDVGAYHFVNLLPGDYQISVLAAGFEKALVNRHVSTDETVGVNIVLTLGAASTTVEVTSAETGLNPDETRVQYTLEAKDVDDLPLPDRATLTTLRVAPGVVGTIETSGSTNTNIPIGQAAPDARANGRPSASNIYLLDRIPISSTTNTGAVIMVPNPDMLAETALQTVSYSLDNGATSSLQIDFTSKSGGDKYHGDFDLSYTSKPFEASPDFGGVAPFHRKYYMGSFGGPIIKNTFFFGSIERIENLSALGGLGTGINADPNVGIGWWAQTAAGGFNAAPFTSIFSYPDSALSNKTTKSTAGDFYPNAALITAGTAAQKFGQQCGVSTGPASTFGLPCTLVVTEGGEFNQNPGITGQQYNLRFDHSLNSDKDKFYVSYFGVQQNSDYIDPRPAFDTKTPSQSYYFSAGYSHVFTGNFINQLNAGMDRFWGGGKPNPLWAIYPKSATGFLFWQDPGTPDGFVGGNQETPGTPYLGQTNKEHVFALRDYVSWLKGRHTFKFGFQTQIRNYWQDAAATLAQPAGPVFTDLLQMLQGEADSVSLYTISAVTGKYQSQILGAQENQFGAYAQDDWKIKPNLLLTFGIRWDDFGNPTVYGEDASPFANTVPGSGSTLEAQVGSAVASTTNQAFTSGQTWNFLPRGAFSWSPEFSRATVVRGGVGLYQDSISLNQITANLPTSTPVRLTLTLDDADNYFNCGSFYCVAGGTPWTGVSGVAGQPDSFAWTGTQGTAPPYGIPYPTLAVNGFNPQGLALQLDGTPYSVNLYGVDPKLKPASTVVWSFGLEQELPNSIVVGATYTGSHSYNQFLDSQNYNNPPGNSLAATAAGFVAPPLPAVNGINLLRNVLSSNYNALILTATQRKGNLSWQANYLWSHALGNPGTGETASPYTATAQYGNLDGDVRQRITFSGAYQLSTSQTFLGKGWSLGGIFIGQDGTPFTVFTPQDVNEGGTKDGSGTNLPDVVFQPGTGLHYGKYSNSQFKSLTGIFNGACGTDTVTNTTTGAVTITASSGSLYSAALPNCPFQTVTTPNPKTLEGNEKFNGFNNPGYWDVDLNLQKKIELPWFGDQKSHLNLRFEALNAFNHANLNGFGSFQIGSAPNSTMGAAYQAENPRIMQFGGRFEF
ncbi:MAG: carboxypeptidase regulatory-like domain-containing protein [Terracidiphilus sp.]